MTRLPSASKTPGALRGVGLGPGDPELMTLKAHRLISKATAIAYPAPLRRDPETGRMVPGASLARAIAQNVIPDTAEEIVIAVPMTAARAPAQAAYDAGASAIAARLEAGVDVVALCEGDPLFYGSFMYLLARLGDRFTVEITPGVTSVTACAALAGAPLIARDEPFQVLPATMDAATLAARLAHGGPAAIMKVGRRLPALKRLLATARLTERAVYVARAGFSDQIVAPLADAPDSAPYFSMILIHSADPFTRADAVVDQIVKEATE